MSKELVGLVRKSPTKSKLRSFLDEKEPELAYFLQSLWHNQGKAITYKELREALLSKEMKPEWLEEWQQDYSRFVQDRLLPFWMEAMEAGTKELPDMRSGWYFNPMAEGAQQWARQRGAAFVTNSTRAQLDGLRAVIGHSVVDKMTVDELARAVRPMIGLTYQQAVANANYLQSMLESGMSEQKAAEKAILYAARQHRYRGYNIARTELAFSYNQGALQGARQAQAQGYLGEVVKVWRTANDDIPSTSPNYRRYRNQGLKPRRTSRGMAIGRTCETCESLDGMRIELDADFPFRTKLTMPGIQEGPPVHPSCRCSIQIVEISPPSVGFDSLQDEQRYDIIEGVPGQLRNAAGVPIIEVDHIDPRNGPPNGITQKTNKRGGIDRNFYDERGRQVLQVSNHNHGAPKNHPFGKNGEHQHRYSWDDHGNISRTNAEEISDSIRRENYDFL